MFRYTFANHCNNPVFITGPSKVASILCEIRISYSNNSFCSATQCALIAVFQERKDQTGCFRCPVDISSQHTISRISENSGCKEQLYSCQDVIETRNKLLPKRATIHFFFLSYKCIFLLRCNLFPLFLHYFDVSVVTKKSRKKFLGRPDPGFGDLVRFFPFSENTPQHLNVMARRPNNYMDRRHGQPNDSLELLSLQPNLSVRPFQALH